MKTPILFLIFNRLDETQRSFECIRNYAPDKLFISCDGPRNSPESKEVDKCKEYVLQNIDWDCQIHTNFNAENLGCGISVSSAISWFFDHVEEGIILEDDCIPNESFFTFCSDLLQKYRDNKNVFHVSGLSWIDSKIRTADYYFSKYPGIWGWATWRDRWEKYEFHPEGIYPYIESREFRQYINRKSERETHKKSFINYKLKDTWDIQWRYKVFSCKGVCITPKVNLVTNIGFGEKATHTKELDNWKNGYECVELNFPLTHPEIIVINSKLDREVAIKNFKAKKSWLNKLIDG